MLELTDMILDTREGGTSSLTGGELPVTGYFVGGVVSPLIIEPEDSLPEARWNVDAFIVYLRGLRQVSCEFVGWWTDEETGKLWIDGTTWHETEFQAGRAGRGRREIAIYDIERQRELRLAYVEGE